MSEGPSETRWGAGEGSETGSIGVVAIGRNEGDRLRRCLDSVVGRADGVVYVDSGSTDGSVALGREKGVAVVSLDMSIPFTAARARNAGFEHLLAIQPAVGFVQFLDGDCEMADAWLEQALASMRENADVVVVCGRRRERARDASPFNRLMDMEWDSPVGEADACGGDALMRVEAFRQVGGFDPTMIAGEEPELCVRLRRQGGRILRIDADMTFHDAAMTRFSQWWQRTIRNGYAYSLGAGMHGRSAEKHWVGNTRRVWFWGAILPGLFIALAWPTAGLSLLALGVYPLWALRIASRRHREFGDRGADALLYGAFCMLSRFPQILGQLRYHWHRLRGRSGGLIEYK